MALEMYLEKIDRMALDFIELESTLSELEERDPTLFSKLKPYLNKRGIPGVYEVESLFEEVAHWNKANQIHTWFANHIQDGEDNRKYYEVTKGKLRELLEVCKAVLDGSVVEQGQVSTGYGFDEAGNRIHHYAMGKVIANPRLAQHLLPTRSGPAFGSTDYDEDYIKDVVKTAKIIKKVLRETNFRTHAIYYHSNW